MLDYCQITKSHSYTAQPVLSDHPWETEEWSFNRGGRLIEGIPPAYHQIPNFCLLGGRLLVDCLAEIRESVFAF